MSKIILDDDSTNLDPLAINENFRKIEKEFNEKVFYRKNPNGEPNELENDLDMNGNRIYNLPKPVEGHEPLRLVDIGFLPEEIKEYAEASKEWAEKSQDAYEHTLEALAEGSVYIGDYGPGLVIDEYTNFFGRGGFWWRPSPDLELPYTTTGDWATDGDFFERVGDALLRQELGSDVGATYVKGAAYEIDTVENMVLITGLTDGQRITTNFHNVEVKTEWEYRKIKPDGFHIVGADGYFLLISPSSFCAAGLKAGSFNPEDAWHNRNVIQGLIRDTRFNEFSYGVPGDYKVLGAIYPLRNDIRVLHEVGVHVSGHYNDPSIPDSISTQVGAMFAFVHYRNPDGGSYENGDYDVIGETKNVHYVLNGTIETVYSETHSKLHNNNVIAFYESDYCTVTGVGGVTGSDYRGINFDGEAKNCHINIGFVRGTADEPIVMKVSENAICSIKVKKISDISFNGVNTNMVFHCRGAGHIEIEIGEYTWDGIKKAPLVNAYGCKSLSLKPILIDGVTSVIRMIDANSASIDGGNFKNTTYLISRAETAEVTGSGELVEIRGIKALDSQLQGAYLAETNDISGLKRLVITDGDYEKAASTFGYHRNRRANEPVELYDLKNNLNPTAGVNMDLNPLQNGRIANLITPGITSFSFSPSDYGWHYGSLTVIAQNGSKNYSVTVDVRTVLSTSAAQSYNIGDKEMTVARSSGNVSINVPSGSTLQIISAHN